jgi:phosphonate transport system ATP-binding protein
MNLLHDLSREMGKTLVVSLHAIDFALSHFDRIVGLREGRILFDCPAHEVTSSMISMLYEIKKPAPVYG